MSKPKLLDLYCKAGGAGMGYYRAGFDVTGVDIEPQKRYPFTFVQADALAYVAQYGWRYDAIHASPPCQGFSRMTLHKKRVNHHNLIPATRFWLKVLGLPYVIENVGGAAHELFNPLMLCGSMFSLPIWRHRYFEVSTGNLILVPPCQHNFKPVLITDNGGPNANGWGKPRKSTPIAVKRQAIGIDWMTNSEITEAIPPAYTEFLGRQLMNAVLARHESGAA